jgi:hypothetical protein
MVEARRRLKRLKGAPAKALEELVCNLLPKDCIFQPRPAPAWRGFFVRFPHMQLQIFCCS